MHGLIDIATGTGESLTSNDDFDLLATVMDDQGVYAGYMTDCNPGTLPKGSRCRSGVT